MVRIKSLVGVLAIVVLVVSPARLVRALVAEPREVGLPIPDEWRGPISRFLIDLETPSIDDVLRESRAGRFTEEKPDRIILRVVGPNSCTPDRDLCLSVIGRIADGLLSVEAMFWAGAKVTRLDTRQLGTSRSPPMLFIGTTNDVAIIDTVKGLVLIPQPRN